ncbi:hypothetical protein BpHYR1_027763 [Brachionus plicatilis]|uniref:Uncharacterized protein n=1 Tax=Brachionus plicatilis TaxID=10195 RepID=A0A3M7RB55_BRAPC|nr:hypothetical protein BpHYR1_027763 [Brachionus plicatilis]
MAKNKIFENLKITLKICLRQSFGRLGWRPFVLKKKIIKNLNKMLNLKDLSNLVNPDSSVPENPCPSKKYCAMKSQNCSQNVRINYLNIEFR